MQNDNNIELNEDIEVGTSQISWETFDRLKHDRTKSWFIISIIIGVLLLVYAIVITNYIFAIVIAMMGIITLTTNLREPQKIDIHITDAGVVIGNDFYDYTQIKDFSIIYEPPEIKILYIDFNSILEPILTISLEEIDPNAVREALIPYIFENLSREEETLTDMVKRMYKL